MMAKSLEVNGATVYIVGRRIDLLEKVAREAVSQRICLLYDFGPCRTKSIC